MPHIHIRPATAGDADTILGFVHALAEYDNAPERVVATAEDLRRDGLGAEAWFEALIAELGGTPVGYALFYPTYTAWEGRPGLFLEDVFLAEEARGKGVGRRVMAALAAIALARGWTRIDLRVRADNRARSFYDEIGMGPLEGWLSYKLSGEPLAALAAEAPAPAAGPFSR